MLIGAQTIEESIYPLTIVSDRYGGAYSCAEFTAWNLEPWSVPKEIDGDDVGCMWFWEQNEIVCGKGNTIEEAVGNLYIALKMEVSDG